MSHVDEGMLHAYLDGGIDAPRERERIEGHLALCADCSTLLEAARADRDEARELLALLDPGEIRVPPFEELEGRRSGTAGSSGRRFRIPVAWAASVLLAVGGGWMARGIAVPPADDAAAFSRTAGAPAPTAEATATDGEAPAPPIPQADVAARAPEPSAPAAPAEERVAVADPMAEAARVRAETPAETVAAPETVVAASGVAPAAPTGAVAAGREALEDPVVVGTALRARATPLAVTERSVTAPPAAMPPSAVAERAAVAGASFTGDAVGSEIPVALAEFTSFLRGLPGDASWVPLEPAEAEGLLGRPLATIAGLPVERVDRLDEPEARDRIIVRAHVRLEDGTPLVLMQSLAPPEAAFGIDAILEKLRAEVTSLDLREAVGAPLLGRDVSGLLVAGQGPAEMTRLRDAMDRIVVPGPGG